MKKIWIGIVLILLVMMTGCSPEKTEAEANGSEDLVPVAVSSASMKIIQDSYLGIGKIEAGTALDIYTGGAGKVKDVYVAVGDTISVGQKLFALDADSFQSNLNATESSLRTRRDNLKAQLNDSQINYDKKKVLFEAGALSQSELDAALSQLTNLKSQYADAATAYSEQTGTLKDALGDRTATSPIAGRVASISIQEGDTVQNKVAVQIIDEAIMKVTAQVSGSLLDALDTGGSALVYPDGDRSVPLQAVITAMSYTADAKTGLYEIEAVIEDRDAQLRNGAYAELEFLINDRNAVLIPKKALIKRGETQIVFVSKDGKAEEREVKVGLSVDEWVEIFSGIGREDAIIVEGQRYVKDGTPVLQEDQK